MKLRAVLYPALAASCAGLYFVWSYFRRHRRAANIYETRALLNEYLLFHYGTAEEILPWETGPREALDFAKRCAELCAKHFKPAADIPSRALDVGCGVGGAAFELTLHFRDVLGIDYSHAFVEACDVLKKAGQIDYEIPREGEVGIPATAVVSPSANRRRASFEWGDACHLRQSIGTFGCVLAANLLCRLVDATKFLNRLPSIVARGGILVLTSPYTIKEEFTPKNKWLGGFTKSNGEVQLMYDRIVSILLPDFDLIESLNMPFLLKTTARKYEYVIAHATVWRRK